MHQIVLKFDKIFRIKIGETWATLRGINFKYLISFRSMHYNIFVEKDVKILFLQILRGFHPLLACTLAINRMFI